MRLLAFAVLVVSVACVLSGAIFPTQSYDVWSGLWRTNSGKVGFRYLTQAEIARAKTEAEHRVLYDRLPCKSSPDFYRGGYSPGTDTGKVLACAAGPELRGRWASDSQASDTGSFDVKITSANPLEFSGTATPDGGKQFKYEGIFLDHFAGDGSEVASVTRLDFRVLAKGKPNLSKNLPGLVKSTLSGGGYVSFEGKPDSNGLLMPTDPLNVGLVQTDTYSDGTTKTIKLGIIKDASFYSPRNNRVALTLKVKESDDPNCPESDTGLQVGQTQIRAAVLTLIPVGGVKDAAIFNGVEVTKTVIKNPLSTKAINLDVVITPCRGHFHSWENGPGVTVRVTLTPK